MRHQFKNNDNSDNKHTFETKLRTGMIRELFEDGNPCYRVA